MVFFRTYGVLTPVECQIRKRFKQILDARKEISKRDFNVFIERDAFLDLANNLKCIRSDHAEASLLGFLNIDTYTTYYCPVEDFSDEELENIFNWDNK